jgi:hypothetical protein
MKVTVPVPAERVAVSVTDWFNATSVAELVRDVVVLCWATVTDCAVAVLD